MNLIHLMNIFQSLTVPVYILCGKIRILKKKKKSLDIIPTLVKSILEMYLVDQQLYTLLLCF